MATDVVCGMEVDESQAESDGLTSDYQGQTYVFCSADCKDQFDEDPGRYMPPPTGNRSQPPAGGPGAI